MKKETIAAISTGMTNSGIGIVRISGEEAFSIADRVYRGKDRISCVKSHTIHYGHITDGEETVDEVLVMAMRSPHTFTGEDTVEINCHGGTFVVKRVLEAVLKNGARPAEPGEFTKRAFLNGKIDLSQAEAVIDVINSENEYALLTCCLCTEKIGQTGDCFSAEEVYQYMEHLRAMGHAQVFPPAHPR